MNDLWDKILVEARQTGSDEPIVKRLIEENIDEGKGFLAALSSILSHKLSNVYLSQPDLEELLYSTLVTDCNMQEQITADLHAYFDRDFACETYLEVLLLYRGFQGVTAYRVARAFHLKGQKLTAKFLQNRIFEVYGMDIHPNARLGKGIVIDHGIGLVIGETAEIGDYAFIFHNVTLGGTGHEGGDRHPKIKDHVFIGAGATILGNITIHDHVNIAAGSVVTKEVPAHTTVAGVPAKPIGVAKKLQ